MPSTTFGSVRTATTASCPPQRGHRRGSTSKMRRRSRAQLARDGEPGGTVSAAAGTDGDVAVGAADATSPAAPPLPALAAAAAAAAAVSRRAPSAPRVREA